MLGTIILIVLLCFEIGFMVYTLVKKNYQKEKRSIASITIFIILSVITLIGVLQWSFRWYLLFFIFLIKAIIAGVYLLRRKDKKVKTYKKKYVIIPGIGNILLITFSVLPAIIFPQFQPMKPTGEYKVGSISYTLTDPNRIETFNDSGENRKVTIQFWYPKNVDGKFPIVVFSHGAFGYRGSNRSTYKELASNGYVVCSIDHTYHSFMTKQTDGKTILMNQDFFNDTMAATKDEYDEEKTYQLSQEWLKLRMDDMNFVLGDILNKSGKADSDIVYQMIDTDKIGLFGHSLGGATAAECGRERSDIDAVIVIDGTMLGEEIGFQDGKEILNTEPYPVPILNIYNEEHYKEALQNADNYANMVATAGAVDARQVVVKGAGHLNFTDLPMFSPFLASLLGTGDVDSKYCIKTMNHIVLEYFNYYLKDTGSLDIKAQY